VKSREGVLGLRGRSRRSLLSRLEQAQEEERRRIAADIHDDSLQVIAAADLRLAALDTMLDDPALRQEVAEIHITLQLAADRLRHLLFELLPPALDQDGLAAALRRYLADRNSGLDVAVEDRLETEPPLAIRRTLFRMAQEAISNTLKHSGATRLDIVIATDDGGITLRVSDDGTGFDVARLENPTPGHIGLSTIVERAELAGGWCRIDSRVGAGTTLEVWAPLEP
jgi:signal transduction histidine kinase